MKNREMILQCQLHLKGTGSITQCLAEEVEKGSANSYNRDGNGKFSQKST
jgi:hypothetical protein